MLLRDQHGEASRGLHIYTIRITESDKSNKSNKSIRIIILENVSEGLIHRMPLDPAGGLHRPQFT